MHKGLSKLFIFISYHAIVWQGIIYQVPCLKPWSESALMYNLCMSAVAPMDMKSDVMLNRLGSKGKH